jgi:hypothetical protein
MSESKSLLRPVYDEHLNSIFQLHASETETIDLELVQVNALVSPPGNEQFSLIFRAPLSMPPVQGLYSLQHGQLGTSDLLLVPVSRDEAGVYFEAAFNRIIE